MTLSIDNLIFDLSFLLQGARYVALVAGVYYGIKKYGKYTQDHIIISLCGWIVCLCSILFGKKPKTPLTTLLERVISIVIEGYIDVSTFVDVSIKVV